MTFPTGTIRLEAARAIFDGVEFEEVVVGGEVCAYRAVIQSSGETFENKALTKVCAALWQAKLVSSEGTHNLATSVKTFSPRSPEGWGAV